MRSDWPDFNLDYVDRSKDQLKFTVTQNKNFDLPYDVRVTADSVKFVDFIFSPQDWDVTIDISEFNESDLDKVEINPGREIFDSNRFNNSDRWTEIIFY